MRYILAVGAIALALAGCASVVAEPPPPAGAELDEYVNDQQAMQWQWLGASGIEQPEVESEIVNSSDYALNGNECFDQAERFLDTIDVTTITDAQVVQLDEMFQTSMYECQVAKLASPNEVGYYSAAQLDYIYNYFQDSLVPCLQLQGLQVGYAPSREEFATVGRMTWDPYSELGAELPPSRALEIMARCPALPAAAFLAE